MPHKSLVIIPGDPAKDAAAIERRAWATKPAHKPRLKSNNAKWVAVPRKPITYGRHCELLHTIVCNGIPVDVYRNYSRNDGSCSCFSDCGCWADRGHITENDHTYQATCLREKKKRNGKAYKQSHSAEEALAYLTIVQPAP